MVLAVILGFISTNYIHHIIQPQRVPAYAFGDLLDVLPFFDTNR